MANPTGIQSPAVPAQPPMRPGDEAPEGTPGTGENICPVCEGKGQVNGVRCTNCDGTGKVNVGIGGA
jgi:hypothetical protein